MPPFKTEMNEKFGLLAEPAEAIKKMHYIANKI
jgi:hypothetical protein